MAYKCILGFYLFCCSGINTMAQESPHFIEKLTTTEAHEKMSPAEKLKEKLEILGTMNSEASEKKGFFTSFYLPFFAALKEGGFMETASNIMYSSSGDEVNKKWLDENQNKVQAFNKWLNEYKWNKE